MDFHVITAREQQLVMQTAAGHVVTVLPAPKSSLPARAPPGGAGAGDPCPETRGAAPAG